MRGRVRRADEAPPGPPVLAALRCRRCGQAGVAVVAMHFGERGAAEWTWCGPDCAARDGWPWLTGEQQRGNVMTRKAKAADGNGREDPDRINDDLARYADRLENLELERRAAVEAIKDVLEEAHDKGFGKKPLKEVVKRRLETAEEEQKRRDFEEELDAMLARLGMLQDTPLGQAAEAAARAAH